MAEVAASSERAPAVALGRVAADVVGGRSRLGPIPVPAITVQRDAPSSTTDHDVQPALSDHELVETLKARGFAGPLYDRFRDDLARYAMSVLVGWMRSGYIFHLTTRRGLALHPTERDLDRLRRDADVSTEIASAVVAVALRRFRDEALVGGGWRQDRGASLTTYFVGACVPAFANEFRRYSAEARRIRAQDSAAVVVMPPEADQAADPANVAIGIMSVRNELAGLDPRTRAVVALRIDGYDLQEIAEILGETSVRAVEGVLYRWRTKERNRKGVSNHE